MRESVIARSNPPPVFDPGVAVCDFVPIFVERLVVGLRAIAVLRRDAAHDALFEKSLAKGIAGRSPYRWSAIWPAAAKAA
jgi:hypothetical protein